MDITGYISTMCHGRGTRIVPNAK